MMYYNNFVVTLNNAPTRGFKNQTENRPVQMKTEH